MFYNEKILYKSCETEISSWNCRNAFKPQEVRVLQRIWNYVALSLTRVNA